jgi:hypothetical protein
VNRFKIIWFCICVAALLSGCGKILVEEETCESLGNCDDLSSMGLSHDAIVSEMVLSSELKAISSLGVSNELLSIEITSSSVELSSSSRFVAVSSMMSSFNKIWDGGSYKSIDVANIDEWGLVGDDQGAIILPWSDVVEGGNSTVLDQKGNNLGRCPNDKIDCIENWNIKDAVVRNEAGSHEGVFWHADGYISSQLEITDFVPSSKSGWGWAETGWWVIPSYDKNYKGETPFEKAKAMGLTEESWIHLLLSYNAGEELTLEFRGEDIDVADFYQTPPRFSYEGKGSFESISFSVKSLKRAGWSVPATYDVEKVTALGLLRSVNALAEGAQFPSSSPKRTKLEFSCFSIGLHNGDNVCGVALP